MHVGQVALAAGLTAFALQGGVRSTAAALEAGPHAVVAGTAAAGILIGYWNHRRQLRRVAGADPMELLTRALYLLSTGLLVPVIVLLLVLFARSLLLAGQTYGAWLSRLRFRSALRPLLDRPRP